MTVTADHPRRRAAAAPRRQRPAASSTGCFRARELRHRSSPSLVLIAVTAVGQQRLPVRAGHQGPPAQRRRSWCCSPSARRWWSSPATSTCRSARSLGLVAFAAGDLSGHGGGIPVVAVAARRSLLGAGCGLVNGLLVSLGQVPALVVTLGTLYIFRGIDSIWVGSAARSTPPTCRGGFARLRQRQRPRRPVPAADRRSSCWSATGYYLRTYRSGRELYAHRLQPRGRPARRHPGPPADPRRLRRLRRARRARRRAVRWPGSAPSTPAPATATNSPSSAPSWSAASPSSAAAAPSTAPRSARCC